MIIAATSLIGCAQSKPPLYHWGAYPVQLIEFHKEGVDSHKQIEALEKTRERALSKNEKLPPGFEAHLGMLYGDSGAMDKFHSGLLAEKSAFPEGSTFIDYLLSKFKSGK